MVQHLLHLGFGGGHSQSIPQVFSKDTLLLKYFTKPSLMGVVNGRICANGPYWRERIDWELRCYQPIWPGLVMYRIHLFLVGSFRLRALKPLLLVRYIRGRWVSALHIGDIRL